MKLLKILSILLVVSGVIHAAEERFYEPKHLAAFASSPRVYYSEVLEACTRAELHRLKELVRNPDDVNYQYFFGLRTGLLDSQTPLQCAIRTLKIGSITEAQYKNLVTYLLDQKADVNESIGDSTPLYAAILAQPRSISIIDLLLSRGADMKAKTPHVCHSDCPLEGYHTVEDLLSCGTITNVPRFNAWGPSEKEKIQKMFDDHRGKLHTTLMDTLPRLSKDLVNMVAVYTCGNGKDSLKKIE